jgi:hypothetical protein
LALPIIAVHGSVKQDVPSSGVSSASPLTFVNEPIVW